MKNISKLNFNTCTFDDSDLADFIHRTLCHQEERMTLEEIENHPWLVKNTNENAILAFDSSEESSYIIKTESSTLSKLRTI